MSPSTSTSVLLLLGVMVMAIANFPTLISASGDTALLLELGVLLVFAAGLVLGVVRSVQGAAGHPADAPETASPTASASEVSSSL